MLSPVLTPTKNNKKRLSAIDRWWDVPATVADLDAYVAQVKDEGIFRDDEAIKRDLVNVKNEHGETKLHLIAKVEGLKLAPDIVERLVTLGANLTEKDNYDNTVFQHLNRKGLTQEHALYKTLEKFEAIELRQPSSYDQPESTVDDDHSYEIFDSESAGDATHRVNSIETLGEDSNCATAVITEKASDSDQIVASQMRAQEKKSLFRPNNVLISLGVAGIALISYYFYKRSSKKPASAVVQTAIHSRSIF
jgi:ankyrin repeat protein